MIKGVVAEQEFAVSQKSQGYRNRADACRQRSLSTVDAVIKSEWEELAIQWHLLAHQAEQVSGAN